MSTAQVRDPLPIIGMIVMGVAAVVAAAISWVGWPDMADTLEEAMGPNRRPSVATKETVAAGIPALLTALAILPWPLMRTDRWIERRAVHDGLSLEDVRNRARGLSIVWCGLAVVLVTLHVCLVGEMTGRTMPMLQALAVSFGVLLLALAAAIPHFRQGLESIPPQLRATAEGVDRGYRRAVPLLRATAGATVVLGVMWPIIALVIGCGGMCAAMLVAATAGIRER